MIGDTSSPPSVAVVIASHNGAGVLRECLDSLAASEHPVSVLVVDNASTDNSVAVSRSLQSVRCLPQERNLGFGAANNIGIRAALEDNADYLFLLNQDASVKPDTVGRLVDVARRHPQYGVLSPLHLNADGSALDTRFKKNLAMAASEILSDRLAGRAKEVYPLEFANAAAWLVSADCIKRVGGFDPIFFMYGEDVDFVHRACFHGFRIGVVPSARIFHSRHAMKKTGRASARQRIMTQARAISRNLVIDLKHPSYFFTRHLVVQSIRVTAALLESLTTMDWQAVLAHALGMTLTVPRLLTIWRHRGRCRLGGTVWIRPHAGARSSHPSVEGSSS